MSYKKNLLIGSFLVAILILSACSTKTKTRNPNVDDIKARVEQQQSLVQQHDDLVVDQTTTGSRAGYKAADFTTKTIDGNTFSLSQSLAEDKPALIYFFATWCPYCWNDLSVLKEVYPAYKEKINFIAIDLDPTEDLKILKNYKKRLGIDIPMSLAHAQALQDYKVYQTTAKYGIGKDGIIRYAGAGEFSKEQWETLFTGLLQS